MKRTILRPLVIALGISLVAASPLPVVGAAQARFEISYVASVDQGPITGRVFVMISKNSQGEPRSQAGSYGQSIPFFGLDVDRLKPAQDAVIAPAAGFSVKLSLSRKLPPRVVAADTSWVKRVKIQSKML